MSLVVPEVVLAPALCPPREAEVVVIAAPIFWPSGSEPCLARQREIVPEQGLLVAPHPRGNDPATVPHHLGPGFCSGHPVAAI